MQTDWLDVPGWEGIYAVSSDGRVKRYGGTRGCSTDRLLEPSKKPGRYSVVCLCRGGQDNWRVGVHRLVALTFIGPPPSKHHEVNHINGIKTDNRVENLEWVTRSQNIKHSYDTALHPIQSGTNASRAWFSEKDLVQIIKFTDAGLKPKEIAIKLSVPYRAVIDYLYGRTYIDSPRPMAPKALKGSRSLDREKVRQIKSLIAEGNLSARQIAQSIGVSISAVQHIKKGRIWKDIAA